MKKTIMMNINLLPQGFEKNLEGVKQFANTYNINVIPFDNSPQNTLGSNIRIPDIIKLD